jgi:hypothetical protein
MRLWTVGGSCDNVNKHSASMKGAELFSCVRNCQLSNKAHN